MPRCACSQPVNCGPQGRLEAGNFLYAFWFRWSAQSRRALKVLSCMMDGAAAANNFSWWHHLNRHLWWEKIPGFYPSCGFHGEGVRYPLVYIAFSSLLSHRTVYWNQFKSRLLRSCCRGIYALTPPLRLPNTATSDHTLSCSTLGTAQQIEHMIESFYDVCRLR